jgi:hypothetical protein
MRECQDKIDKITASSLKELETSKFKISELKTDLTHKTSLIMEKENHIRKLNEIIVELKDEIK